MSVRIVVETHSIADLDPSSLTDICVVPFKQNSSQMGKLFRSWVDELGIPGEDKLVVCELEHSFMSVLNLVAKMEKRPFSDSKLMLAKRFFAFFEIFLNNLNGKEADRMC